MAEYDPIGQASQEWIELCNQYGDYSAPFEVVHTWMNTWKGKVPAEILFAIMDDTYQE